MLSSKMCLPLQLAMFVELTFVITTLTRAETAMTAVHYNKPFNHGD